MDFFQEPIILQPIQIFQAEIDYTKTKVFYKQLVVAD